MPSRTHCSATTADMTLPGPMLLIQPIAAASLRVRLSFIQPNATSDETTDRLVTRDVQQVLDRL